MGGWLPVVLVFVAGALGGILNALTTDNGFIFPTFATISNGARIWRPGVLGNLIVGAIAAVVSCALYSPSAGLPVGDFNAALTWAGFASAVLVGVGGARWLSVLRQSKLLEGYKLISLSGAQLANTDETLALVRTPGDILERRRIEFRLRKSSPHDAAPSPEVTASIPEAPLPRPRPILVAKPKPRPTPQVPLSMARPY